MVGANGVVLQVGRHAQPRDHPADPAYQVLLKGVWGTGGTIHAVGASGSLLKFDGSMWSASTVAGAMNEILTGITGTAANNLFVSSLSGAIRRFDGTNWTTVSPFGNFGIYSMWASGSDVFAVGDVLYTDTATRIQPSVRASSRSGTARCSPTSRDPAGVALFGVGHSRQRPVHGRCQRQHPALQRHGLYQLQPGRQSDRRVGTAQRHLGQRCGQPGHRGRLGRHLRWNGSQWNSVTNSIYLRFRGLGPGR